MATARRLCVSSNQYWININKARCKKDLQMKEDKGRNIVWLYDDDHLNHPFIRLAADSLTDAGYSVYVLDRAINTGDTRYQHIALGRKISWLITLVHLVNRIIRPPVQTISTAPSTSDTMSSNCQSLSAPLPSCGIRALMSSIYTQTLTAIFLILILLHTLVRRPSIIIASLPDVAAIGWLVSGLWRSRLVYYPFELYGEQHTKVPLMWRS